MDRKNDSSTSETNALKHTQKYLQANPNLSFEILTELRLPGCFPTPVYQPSLSQAELSVQSNSHQDHTTGRAMIISVKSKSVLTKSQCLDKADIHNLKKN